MLTRLLCTTAKSVIFDRRSQRTADRSSLPIVQPERDEVFLSLQIPLLGGVRYLTFGLDRIYCGFEDAIEVFDVHRPGNDEGVRLHTTPSKKAKDGLKGNTTLV